MSDRAGFTISLHVVQMPRLDVTEIAIWRSDKSFVVSAGMVAKAGIWRATTSLTEVMEYQLKTDTRKSLIQRAGDRDRTGDVQLGKLAFYR
jgi:hypothetical protein